ncbi:MAG: alpha/beta fold hydrolase [Alphaproteobacteria bacterium]|nr:alpha/beta fold hydrolase [Alphaproteobacteria bacterium]
MTDFETDIATPDGAMNTFVAHPGSDGPFPAIFMYMPSSGIRDELRDMARRLAAHGYLVLLPNVYYRMVRIVDIDANRLFDDDYEPVKLFMNALNNGYTNALSVTDTAAMIDYVDASHLARKGPLGVVGYCMGGRLALAAIGAFPDRIDAMVSMYGGKLHTDQPDSPHLMADQVKGELYLGVAENDAYVPMDMNKRLCTHLDDAGVTFKMNVYPDTEHGFCFPKRYCYAPEADAQHWEKMTELFARRLG